MIFTEFTIEVPHLGKVDVVRQGDPDNPADDIFWDLFADDGSCLNEGFPFWTKPTEKEVLTFLVDMS